MLTMTLAMAAAAASVGTAAPAPSPSPHPHDPAQTQNSIQSSRQNSRKSARPTAEADARRLVSQMTREEKLRLVFGYFGSPQVPKGYTPPEAARMGSAGYIPGVPRLGIPPLWETDASLGVATQRDSTEPYRVRTSLPSSLATAATFDPSLAYRGGVMIGRQARNSGFNVMLAGGMNLVREPRNGRNFEYAGEDPLLAGVITGAAIRGIQSDHVIATAKHFALNAQETGRMVVNAKIGDAAAQQSDFLAFQFAIEQGRPGSVMCAYNRFNSVYACENPALLGALKGEWKYPGFVMSDWGAMHSTAPAANAGLDQESGYILDDKPYFSAPLAKAVEAGEVKPSRLDDMAFRIVRAMAANGLLGHPARPGGAIDLDADAKVSQADAEAAIVLLKNTAGLLPLAHGAARIAVIGGHADKGVIAGGGSSTVFPEGVTAVPGLEPRTWPGPVVFDPASPLAAIQARAGAGRVTWTDGADVAAAVEAAKAADLVVVFGTQWTAESQDAALSLDSGQDALIEAVTAANPKSVVVLETGGPVRMPWLDRAGAVMEAWYPGSGGGEAIARVLFGEADASGRLPVTFPRDESQLPRPRLDGQGLDETTPFTVDYDIEGAAVGYKWFDRQGLEPLFPFGYGLSYTRFEYTDLKAQAVNGRLNVSFRIRNVGDRPGEAVPQVYVSRPGGGWEAPKRLAGWSKQALRPGESRRVYVAVDPRLLATWDETGRTWKIVGGRLEVLLGASSRDIAAHTSVVTAARRLPAGWRPPERSPG